MNFPILETYLVACTIRADIAQSCEPWFINWAHTNREELFGNSASSVYGALTAWGDAGFPEEPLGQLRSCEQ